MKKIVVLGVVVGFIVFSGLIVNAAPVGNPASPVLLESDTPFKIGAEVDFVNGRELDVSGESVEIEVRFYTGKLSYTIADRIDVYAFFGVIDEAEVDEEVDDNNYKYLFDEDFAWGIGATVLIYELENGIKLGVDAKYRTAEVDLTELDINGTRYGIADISDIQGDFDEWQVALGITKQFGKFIPYGGVKYSDVEVQAKGTVLGTVYQTAEVNSENIFGIFIGCNILPMDNLSLNIEGRFIDETAFSAGLTYRF